VALLGVVADREVSDALEAALRNAGLSVVDPEGDGVLDGLVVLMSRDSVVDRRWQASAEELSATRIVPVRIDGEITDVQVPDRIAPLNWIDWRPANPASTSGLVLVGLYTDPDRHRVAQELAQQALAWAQAQRSDDLLISDSGRAERMQDQLEEMEADSFTSTDPLVRPFVEASMRLARKARRRRWGGRMLALFVLLAAISVVTKGVAEVRSRSLINKATIVTAGDPTVLEDQPEWSAANAAALLLEGTATQRQLGRLTIARALSQPWTYSEVDYLDSIRSMVSFGGGRTGAALTFTYSRSMTGFVLLDLRAGRWIGQRLLPGVYQAIDVASDGSEAVLAGDGVAAIDIHTGRLRVLVKDGHYTRVRVGKLAIAAASAEGDVRLLDLAGHVRYAHRYRGVIDLGEPGRANAHALVSIARGRVGIVDVATGRVIARARAAAIAPSGSLSPDGSRAIVEGDDGEFWQFGAGMRPQPTGIPVPVAVNDVAWAPGDRLVVVSDSERGQVVLLPRGEPLGHVCWGHPMPNEIRLDRHADVLACGGGGAAFWRIPSGPRADAGQGVSSATTDSDRNVTVEAKGSRVRVRFHGRFGTGRTDWSTPLNSVITAVKISPEGDQAAVGSAGGDVATLGFTNAGSGVVGLWNGPEGAPVVAIGWDDGPIASTTTGRHWKVPTCPRCQTDSGLLDAVRARNTGCLTTRQLQWVRETVRRRIGVHVCDPILKFERP